MAQNVLVEIVDDLDGGVATQTVPFALDGVMYEIDLSDENARILRETFARYIASGQRVGGRKTTAAVSKSATGKQRSTRSAQSRRRSKEVREWAQANGYPIAEQGRIPHKISAAFEAGEPAAELKSAPVGESPTTPAQRRAPRTQTGDS
ncbi:Lsr2 family protein [Amycolatopsis sp. SID8362]|uniref:histone-like nucleoid-structuring protein Lsr2 n=1 Tax=Amycolatopsis sp. SID8362 TaxID=2690346 RepID=UPI00137060B5|nr:Lsr2 family protein [Amycolatopsis sp. SID8362]NBH03340.1 Lsr2 family protein [Amycolatopsis sp. SID8362]NED40041.1 Lsr2 family protein [Amycolatopsis sp. SID8362]